MGTDCGLSVTEPKRSNLDVLNDLIADGLTFGDAVKAFAAHQDANWDGRPGRDRQWYINGIVTRGGELEVDDDAIVSVSSDAGAYVMAWVWVGDPEADAARAKVLDRLNRLEEFRWRCPAHMQPQLEANIEECWSELP